MTRSLGLVPFRRLRQLLVMPRGGVAGANAMMTHEPVLPKQAVYLRVC